MIKREQKFNTYFNKFLKYKFAHTGLYELKVTQKNSIPFFVLKLHQEQALLHAKHSTLVFKIPDLGLQNPADTVCLAGVPAYVVVRYHSKKFYLIPIDSWISERNESKRKSLTEQRAEAICSTKYPS